MDGREFESENYRFGFSGHERIDQLKGHGVTPEFGARVFDSRIGMFLSVDPIKYPSLSTYHYDVNNPINVLDIEEKGFIEDFRKGFRSLKQRYYHALGIQ